MTSSVNIERQKNRLKTFATVLSAKNEWQYYLPLVFVVLVGAWLRLQHIGTLPPGMYRDEGFYALDALDVLNGKFSVYFTANNGREPFFIYWLTPFIALFGRTTEAVRGASATLGIFTLITIFWVGRHLFSPRIGVLASAVLAINFWHLAISRVAYRAISLPLLLCIAMATHVITLSPNLGKNNNKRGLYAGIFAGLTLYSYTSAQMILPVMIVWSAFLCMQYRAQFPVVIKHLSHYFLGIFITALPLIAWFLAHPEQYFNRASQVSILNTNLNNGDLLGTVLRNINAVFGMFLVQGDRIWRHNLSLRPVFDGITGLFFIFGVGIIVWRLWRGSNRHSAVYLLIVWLMYLLPSILSEDSPHYLRAIGSLPATCLITALGLERVLAWLSRHGYLMFLNFISRPTKKWVTPPAILASTIFFVSGYASYSDYFYKYAISPQTAFWLESYNTALATLVNETLANEIFIDNRLTQDNPTLTFLSPKANSATSFKLDNVLNLTNTSLKLFVFDPNHDWTALRQSLPHPAQFIGRMGTQAQGDKDPVPRTAFATIETQPLPNSISQTKVIFENGINLITDKVISIAPLNITTTHLLTLTWQANTPIRNDFAIFVHIRRNGVVVAQHDGSPAQGLLPMPFWQSGDIIYDEHPIIYKAQLGDEVVVGIYDRADNTRLTVSDTNGRPLGDSVMILTIK